MLKRDPPGSFIVRSATSKNGLALSVRVPQDFHPEGILNYLIIRAPKGFKIKVHLTGSAIVYHFCGRSAQLTFVMIFAGMSETVCHAEFSIDPPFCDARNVALSVTNEPV